MAAATTSVAGRPRAGRRVSALVMVLVVMLTALFGQSASPVAAQDADAGGEAATAQELAERFAPIIMVKAQDDACDPDGEPYGPTPIDIVLDNPDVVLRQVGNDDPVLSVAPSGSDLFGLSEGFYLDFPGSALSPGCVYEQDFDRYTAEVPATVYAHVISQADEPDRLFVQYWFYWYFNDWNNKHESDWEGIVVEFEAASIEEALATGPSRVGFAQHEGGERADWDDTKLEREGDRPVVYSSAGSHASYFDSGVYLGRSASEGFGCDDTSGPSERLAPEVILLPTEVADADDPFAWLAFDGRWGERQAGPFNGPTGPAAKERWLDPADWFDELRPTSVVIPAGDEQANGVVGLFCGVVESGSGLFIRFINSPVLVVIGLGLLFLVGRFLARRTEWSTVAASPVVARRRAGQIFRASARAYGRAPHVFLLIGVVCIPISFLFGALTALLVSVPGIGPLVELIGGADGTSALAGGLARGVANVLAVVLINAMVASYLAGTLRGLSGARAAITDGFSSWRPLFGAYIRSFVIVTVLLLTIVGIPWAIRQLVRYQFASQSVMLDDTSGRDALRRSSDLIRGRWWHTAVVLTVISTVVGLVTALSGLLLLVAFTAVPLWAFSAIYGIVSTLILPLAAIAITLLYGDAVAEHEEDDEHDERIDAEDASSGTTTDEPAASPA